MVFSSMVSSGPIRFDASEGGPRGKVQPATDIAALSERCQREEIWRVGTE